MMRGTQRYISKELTHFVGRKKKPSSQYKLLVKILKEGWLTHPPHNIYESGNLLIRTGKKISGNEMYSPQAVCFCDIPVEDLALHANKYSKVGLSFDKDFIVNRGGAPVYYIPKGSKVEAALNITPEKLEEFGKPGYEESLNKVMGKGEYFDEVIRGYPKLFTFFHKLVHEAARSGSQETGRIGDSVWDYPKGSDGYHMLDFPRNTLRKLERGNKKNIGRDAIWYDQQIQKLEWFLNFHIFSYVIFFDHNLPEYDEDNYYFEREWCVLGNVQFEMEDVRRVLIPEKYARKFREDCPQYYGQMTFVD